MTGQCGAGANSWRMGAWLSSLCPIRTGEAGTSVGLWAAKGKAWVKRGRNRYLLGGERSATRSWIEAPLRSGSPTQLVTTAPNRQGLSAGMFTTARN